MRTTTALYYHRYCLCCSRTECTVTCIGNNGTFGDRQFIKCDLANFSVVLVRSAFLIKTDRRSALEQWCNELEYPIDIID